MKFAFLLFVGGVAVVAGEDCYKRWKECLEEMASMGGAFSANAMCNGVIYGKYGCPNQAEKVDTTPMTMMVNMPVMEVTTRKPEALVDTTTTRKSVGRAMTVAITTEQTPQSDNDDTDATAIAAPKPPSAPSLPAPIAPAGGEASDSASAAPVPKIQKNSNFRRLQFIEPSKGRRRQFDNFPSLSDATLEIPEYPNYDDVDVSTTPKPTKPPKNKKGKNSPKKSSIQKSKVPKIPSFSEKLFSSSGGF